VPDIAAAAAEYVARFGYRVCGAMVHDPVQTAQVQFLSLTESVPYVELVTPDGPESKLSNALRKGGGLNHLCYLSPRSTRTAGGCASQACFCCSLRSRRRRFPAGALPG